MLRQAKRSSWEAPFLYLFFGADRALLLDTGDVAERSRCDVRGAVDGLIQTWTAAHPGPEPYPVVVAHTHGHRDHRRGDPQFAARAHTTLVDAGLDSTCAFFGFAGWPTGAAVLDLGGGRRLDVLATPGHHRAAITVYDRWNGMLVTGDTVYPGRLYVEDMPAFIASLERLVDFGQTHEVSHVMGCHIELSTSGRDYAGGAPYQPDEAALEMKPAVLQRVLDAARSVSDKPGVHRFTGFEIYHGPCRAAMLRLAARGLMLRVRRAATAVPSRARRL